MKARFMPYQSKPITRMALEIPTDAKIERVEENTYLYEGIRFKAYQPPLVGDYICRLTEDDTYHVARGVFHDRNIVAPVEAK